MEGNQAPAERGGRLCIVPVLIPVPYRLNADVDVVPCSFLTSKPSVRLVDEELVVSRGNSEAGPTVSKGWSVARVRGGRLDWW